MSESVSRLKLFSMPMLFLAFLTSAAPTAPAGEYWCEPDYAVPKGGFFRREPLPEVERLYAEAIKLHKRCEESCVDCFFQVALLTADAQAPNCSQYRRRHLHQSALQKLVVSGCEFGRLNPASGLAIRYQGADYVVPIRHVGFVWRPREFHDLLVVGKYRCPSLSTSYKSEGVGIPLVVRSLPDPDRAFVPKEVVFSATLRMCVQRNANPNGLVSPNCVLLELYDPTRIDLVWIGSQQFPITKDFSAPIAYRVYTKESEIFSRFIRPRDVSPDSRSDSGRLYALEPYQAGKTPVVLIHGLLSDRFTWAEMVNEMLARPDITDRYQFWIFEYPTGDTFLDSASELRSQLEAACQCFDPLGRDPELFNILLIGHSMGGLLAKLQITSSGDRLWKSVANAPLSQIKTSDELRQQLTEVFYFQPSPRVNRVIYIATPHRGSAFATRLIGRAGRLLVREPKDAVERHAKLIRDNPGVFSKQVRRRIPTSIDLLEPNSSLLLAADELPTRCGVEIHSIIGNGLPTLTLGCSDGVVPVKNALDRRASTECFVRTTHSGAKEHPKAVQHVLDIMRFHQSGMSYVRSAAFCEESQQASLPSPVFHHAG